MTTTCGRPSSGPGVRLRPEHVERSAGHLAGPDRSDERVLVDQSAARGVHDTDTVFHLLERRPVEEPLGLVVQREVEGDDVRLRVDLLGRRRRLDTELAEAIGRDEGIVGDDAHAEAERTVRDLASDAPEAQHAERLPGELDPGEALAVPRSRGQRRVRLGHVARECEEQCDRMLGSGVDRRLGRVRDDDAASRRRVDVDVVDPHSGTPDDLELLAALDERRVERRRGPDDDRVEVADDRGEVGLGVLDNLESPAQKLEPGVRDRLADEDAPALSRHGRRRGTPRAHARRRPRARSERRARRAASPPRLGPW